MITTEDVARYKGGQLEVQNPNEGYIYRGEIAEITVEEEDLVVKLTWNAKGEGYPPIPKRWVHDKTLGYQVSLMIYTSSDIGQDRLALRSVITGELAVLFPPEGSKLDRAKVEIA